MAGGGSGGHITPLLSLAHELKLKSPKTEVIYVGLRGEKLDGLGERLKIFDSIYRVSSGKLRRYHGQSLLAKIFDFKTLFLNIVDSFKVVRGYFQARKLLKRLKPDVVLSKGGFAALPTGWAAHKLRIPLITHDSDRLPGLTNRLLGRHAALHATAYETQHYTGHYPEASLRYTGLPLDERLKPVTAKVRDEYRQKLGLSKDSFILLVTGGGLGSKTLNQKTVALAKNFLESPDNHLLHFTGSAHLATVEKAYELTLSASQLLRVKVIGFTPEFYVYSGAADVVITRAGASSIAELAAQHKACIVIPADFLTGGHQSLNISDWQSKNAIMQADDAITPQNLLKLVKQLKQNQHLRHELGQNLGSIIRTDGADQLATLILGFRR